MAASGSRSALGTTGRTEGRLRARLSVAGDAGGAWNAGRMCSRTAWKTPEEEALLAVVAAPVVLGLSQTWARQWCRPMIIASFRHFLLASYSDRKSFIHI